MNTNYDNQPGARKELPPRTKKRKQNFIMRAINEWFSRLLGAASEGSFSEQEEAYASDRTTRDYIWNTLGTSAWGMVFPVLTIVITQLSGVEQAGMFSMAFVVGMLLWIIANYGVRAFQVSDLEEDYSFSDYQLNRVITCIVAMIVGAGYCMIRGYGEEMFTLSMGVYFYKMIDGFADVYEGRLQQMNKLYLAGISQTLRSVIVIIVFSLCLLITRSLPVACIAMGITALATLVLFTAPLALFETPKSKKANVSSSNMLLKQCFTLFIALFMYALIDNMPKFVMEGMMSYDNQLYFNALYFPSKGILLTIALIYRPQIVRMAKLWADPTKHKKFDLFIVIILAITLVFTLIMIFIMGWIGIPIMSFMYGIDFEEFRGLSYIMLAAGGITAAIDFLYLVITVLRKQKAVMKIYIITFGFSIFVPLLMATYTGLPGVIIGYLIVMTLLLVLLIGEYASIRVNSAQEVAAGLATGATNTQPATTQRLSGEETAKRPRPSELRADRERLAQHRGEGMSKTTKRKK